ncbi:methyltransferase [Virgisporangium aurantiacum]|uniref:Methyltransferase n=1 Tax=Virgisporangium aurantiacum TaxID=175570 RepID=A0A8J3ZAN0_9ACTN|nr:methyltransferase [Virgisporangium aurantiacum]
MDARSGHRVDPARWVAFQTISAVHRDDGYANLVLPKLLTEHHVHGLDAAFATELAYGTLRQSGSLDAVIAAAADRGVERIDPPTRDALRLGAYQLLHTRVATHAATNTTVDLVRTVAPGAIGFANAVMRRIGRQDWPAWLDELGPDDVGLRYAHPPWVVRAFRDALDKKSELEDLLVADNTPAPVHLCARPGRITAADLAAETGGTVGPYGAYAVHLAEGSPGDHPAVKRGLAHVQDEGSQLVATALADAPVDGPDSRWLDLCAGPGGKSALLGSLAALRDARVTAVEVAPHRARLVEHAVRGLPVDVVCEDGREFEDDPFDRVLVDAPCTGLGALRRRPEARWRRQPNDLPPLTRLQRELLLAALRLVRPGGIVAYVTCSPHINETRMTVNETIRRFDGGIEQVDARPLMENVTDSGDGPAVQLWPHRHGTDAMFLSLLKRA